MKASTTWRPTTSRSGSCTRPTSSAARAGTIEGNDDPLITHWATLRKIEVLPRVNCLNVGAEEAILNQPAVSQKMIEHAGRILPPVRLQRDPDRLRERAPERARTVHDLHHDARRTPPRAGRQALHGGDGQVLERPHGPRGDVQRRRPVGALRLRAGDGLGLPLGHLRSRLDRRIPAGSARSPNTPRRCPTCTSSCSRCRCTAVDWPNGGGPSGPGTRVAVQRNREP